MKNHLESLIVLEYSDEISRMEIVCVCEWKLCSFIMLGLSKGFLTNTTILAAITVML